MLVETQPIDTRPLSMGYVTQYSSRRAQRNRRYARQPAVPVTCLSRSVRTPTKYAISRILARLAEAGLSDDDIFEVTIAAAVGAAMQRLDAGMRAVRGST